MGKAKREIFLEELPRKIYNKREVIDWDKSIGYKVKFTYDDIEGYISIIDYIGNGKRGFIYIKHKGEELFKIEKENFKNCNLGIVLGKITHEFKIEIGQTFKDNNRDITVIDRKYKKNNRGHNRKYYKYKCNKCGFDGGKHYNSKSGEYQEEHWILENDLLKGNGCACCCATPRIVVQGINDIPTTAPWMIKYFQGGYDEAKLYTKSSGQSIFTICPDCGRVKDNPTRIYSIHISRSIGCICSDGVRYPNKFAFNMLKQLNINFETEYSPEWCVINFNGENRKCKYDFYFIKNNKKYILEMDGRWHKNDNKMSNLTAEESKYIDSEKDKLAKDHNIYVIRIDSEFSYMEYIRNNILNSKLSEIFNLSIINWLKCEEFALSNRVKEACELKRNNPEYTTLDIANIMNIHRKTIIEYLKKGVNLGWCDYNSKEELRKSTSKNGKSLGKQVEIFKDGVSLGIFESTMELERKSEELFKTMLNNSMISKVCNGKSKLYKGFIFKYTNKKQL